MAKRRLLQWMRDRLTTYAETNVAPVAETKALAAAYKRADPLVRKIVEAKFKPADMAICAKYDLTRRDACIQLTFPNGVVQQFNFDDRETSPLVAGGSCRSRMYLSDDKTAVAVEAWITARDALKTEAQRRITAYRALIDGSTNLDDVIAVWPEVGALFPPANDLIPLGPEQIALVQADIQERKAA